ncbi:MAG: PAS domain S-box protein [Deltaproteobacteria bacterium]|nr:PAS domain S-box protein [Deltaproteobacteria bacterium]
MGTNIADRLINEEALRQSEEKYRSMVENANEAIVVFQDEFPKFFNAKTMEILSYPREVLATKAFLEFVHPEDRPLVFSRYVRRLKGEEPPSIYSFRIIDGQGNTKWVEVNSILINWEKRPAVLVFFSDITGRKKAEESLCLSEEKLSKAFRASPDLITISTLAEGRYVDANDAFLNRTGYNREEVIGHTAIELDLWADPEDRLRALEHINQTGSLSNFEIKAKMRSGEIRNILLSMEVIELEDQKCLLSVSRDITELRQAEEEAKRNTALQEVINSLLRLSLKDIPLEIILDAAIDLILSVPWLVLESKGAIFLVEEDPGLLVMKAHRGLNKILIETCSRVPFGKCICGKAALKKEIEFADHIDERHDIGYETMLPHGHYCVPILFSNQVLGVINFYVREGHHRQPKEEAFLTALANTLASIIIRKQGEAALRESEDRYRDLVETSRDLISIHDLNGQILWVNEEPIRILGFNKDEILKMNIRDLLDPERRGAFEDYLSDIRSKGVARGLMMVRTAKGEARIWEYHNTLRSEGVDEPFVRGIARDVTEQKLAEKEARKTMAKLRKTMGGIILVISHTVEMRDPYTAGHQRRVADLGRAIAQEMGLSEVRVVGIRMAGVFLDLG